jgi:hypothetical protein
VNQLIRLGRAPTPLDEVADARAARLGPRVGLRHDPRRPETTHHLLAVAISPRREDDGSGSADTDDNDAGDGALRCRVHRGLQREAGGPTHVRDGAARLPLRLPNRPNQPDERRLIARICAVPRQSGLVGLVQVPVPQGFWGFKSLRPHSIVPTGRSAARLSAASPTSCATGSGRSAARRWSDRQPPTRMPATSRPWAGTCIGGRQGRRASVSRPFARPVGVAADAHPGDERALDG